MKVKIDTNSGKALRNFWNSIHFHPTDAIEDEWGHRVIENVKKDRVAKYMRIHAMLEDIVRRDSDGKLIYDFSESDNRIDYLAESGFDLLICFDFMPVCIAKDPLHSFNPSLRYKNKHFCFSAPADYNEWEEVCAAYTSHLIERYGAEKVENWYFHCWNEPDSGFWLSNKGNDAFDADGDTDKIEEYIKLYDYFAAGVTSVSDKIRIGGPSCAGSDRFIGMFMDHVTKGINTKTGKTGARCDFISIHCYSQGTYSGLPNKTYVSPDNIMQRLGTIHKMMEERGIGDKEVLFDEWGIAGGGFLGIDRDPRMIFRETEYYPAFYARLIDLIIRNSKLNMPFMMICLSGQHEGVTDFCGYRSFFTINGFKKPIYNGYSMLGKLGGILLENDAVKDEYSGVIPTKDDKGNVKVLVYRHCDVYDKVIPNEKVSLTLDGMDGKYTVNHYRIDKCTSNSYTKWRDYGSPAMPNFEQREAIMAAGNLATYCPSETVDADGTLKYEVIMQQNSVSLIEFIKE